MTAKLTLLKYPHTTDNMIDNRIDGLFDLMSKTEKDFIPELISALVWYITESYEFEGEDYLFQVEIRLIEALYWYKKAMEIE